MINYQKWESILVEYFLEIKTADEEIEKLRQSICKIESFNPVRLFFLIDTSSNSYITLTDFRSFFANNKIEYNEIQIRKFIRNYDKDYDFSINFKEFLNIILPKNDLELRQFILKKIENNEEQENTDKIDEETLKIFIEIINKELSLIDSLEKITNDLQLSDNFTIYESFLCIVSNEKYITIDNLQNYLNKKGIKVNNDEAKNIMFRIDADLDGKISYEEFQEIFYTYTTEENGVNKKSKYDNIYSKIKDEDSNHYNFNYSNNFIPSRYKICHNYYKNEYKNNNNQQLNYFYKNNLNNENWNYRPNNYSKNKDIILNEDYKNHLCQISSSPNNALKSYLSNKDNFSDDPGYYNFGDDKEEFNQNKNISNNNDINQIINNAQNEQIYREINNTNKKELFNNNDDIENQIIHHDNYIINNDVNNNKIPNISDIAMYDMKNNNFNKEDINENINEINDNKLLSFDSNVNNLNSMDKNLKNNNISQNGDIIDNLSPVQKKIYNKHMDNTNNSSSNSNAKSQNIFSSYQMSNNRDNPNFINSNKNDILFNKNFYNEVVKNSHNSNNNKKNDNDFNHSPSCKCENCLQLNNKKTNLFNYLINIIDNETKIEKVKEKLSLCEDINLLDLIEFFDISKSDYVTPNDLMNALELCGLNIEIEDVKILYRKYDKNLDGKLDCKEFYEMILSKKYEVSKRINNRVPPNYFNGFSDETKKIICELFTLLIEGEKNNKKYKDILNNNPPCSSIDSFNLLKSTSSDKNILYRQDIDNFMKDNGKTLTDFELDLILLRFNYKNSIVTFDNFSKEISSKI